VRAYKYDSGDDQGDGELAVPRVRSGIDGQGKPGGTEGEQQSAR